MAALLCPLVVLGIFVGAAESASAYSREIDLVKIDAERIGSSFGGLGGVELDEAQNRGFVLDRSTGKVALLDLTDAGVTAAGYLSPGPPDPWTIALDDDRDVLYALDRSAPRVVLAVDVNRDSPTMGAVTASYPTGGTGAAGLAIDSDSHEIYVINASSNDVSVIKVPSGETRSVPTGREPVDIVVDSSSHRAFVASTIDRSITTIFPSGSSTVQTENRALMMAQCGGDLYTITDRPTGYHVEKFDTGLRRLTVSSPLGTIPDDMIADCPRHALYLSNGTIGVPGMQALRTDDLRLEGATPEDSLDGLALDTRGRLYASETTRTAGSSVQVFEPQMSPLPSVDRVGGADRFAVSAALSAGSFSSGVGTVFIASGTGFADALSGSAAAGKRNGPVLLVTKDGIPTPVADELTRLKPRRIVVLGGTAAVGSDVERQLRGYSSSVSRIGGADRFVVSAAISAATFDPYPSIVYLASGATFPDALSGSAAAGRAQAPVLLVQKDGIPDAIAKELARLQPTEIVVLGGPDAIAEPVYDEAAQLAPTSRISGADRFAVSADISAQRFHDGTFTAYVASGENFPDALSGSAVAIKEGSPVLLVTRDAVPAVVEAELRRLRPYRIVVLGGPAAVSTKVEQQLADYLSG
ncbi:cell wall-binding repeat-containing protein [Herbiconiux flava]|uniref:YVTN family beta-propeller protein n=1 Tax=Herbiconiux flava TaxID=881268 RepID=A0A852SP54_9MICO|nr:cell wall-binding repeat-containing protein [Herbiconiux flava]NYD70631.1 YVTN family beta-propeller protein [Herbiconiux flava]